MSVDLFGEDETLNLAREILLKGSFYKGSVALGQSAVVRSAYDRFEVYPDYLGNPREYKLVVSKDLEALWQEKASGWESRLEVLGSTPEKFTPEMAEMIEQAKNLARAMDITPTAAQRLIEMRTKYEKEGWQ